MSENKCIADWQPRISGDDILRLQGADPAVLRSRSPRVGRTADHAADVGKGLIVPYMLWRRRRIADRRHEKIWFDDRSSFSGRFVATHLGHAEEVVVVVCTIGPALEGRVSDVTRSNPAFAFALEQYGILSIGLLADHVVAWIDAQAKAERTQLTERLSPGMVGWSVEPGQRQIFRQLGEFGGGVVLTVNGYMRPRMSVSFLVGLGRNVLTAEGSPCDCCTIRERCTYRSYYG
ncbi:MAG: hypothetical protein R3282_06575 [Rhodothermales bacterium]|nr:hypothetical protein [Rhodothermales bacterium]